MKKFFKIFAVLLCILMTVTALAACGPDLQPDLDAANDRIEELEGELDYLKANIGNEFLDWYRESTYRAAQDAEDFMFNACLRFSSKAEDRIPIEYVTNAITFAATHQTAVNFNEAYFVIFSTDAAIQTLIDDPHGMPYGGTSPKVPMTDSKSGLVVVLVFGRYAPIRPTYWSVFDSGGAGGLFNLAIIAQGWRTHWFCGYNWDEQNKYDPISWNGNAGTTPVPGHQYSDHMVEKYLFDKGYTYTGAAMSTSPGTPIPVENATWQFLHGIVIGKPNWEYSENIAQVVTRYARPVANYGIVK